MLKNIISTVVLGEKTIANFPQHSPPPFGDVVNVFEHVGTARSLESDIIFDGNTNKYKHKVVIWTTEFRFRHFIPH